MAFLTNKCGVKRVAFSVVLFILVAVGCGLIIWQYLPQKHKDAVGAYTQGGIPISTGGRKSAPPPTYVFNQCQQNQNQSNCCNGIEGLCQLGVDAVLYAGVHNAYASAQDGFYIAPNQDYNSVAALDYGYRMINYDVGVCNGQIVFVHSICELGTLDPTVTFTAMQKWLDNNPNEVVIIPIQIVNGLDGVNVDLGKFYNLLSGCDGFTDRMYQKVDGQPWPTLQEMVDTDKRIIMFHYNGDSCATSGVVCPPGFHDYFSYAGETQFEFTTKQEFYDKAYACNITRGQRHGPFFGLNLFMNVPNKGLSSSVLNTKAFLQNHIQACSDINGGLDVNTVFVDFWSEGDFPEVVQIHNALLAQQRRKRSLRV